MLVAIAGCSGAQSVTTPAPDTGGDFVIHGRHEAFETYTVEPNDLGLFLKSTTSRTGGGQSRIWLQLDAAWAPVEGRLDMSSSGMLLFSTDLRTEKGLLSAETIDDAGGWERGSSAPIDLYLSDAGFAPLTAVCVAIAENRRILHILSATGEETRRLHGDGRITLDDIVVACDGPLLLGAAVRETRALRVGREADAEALFRRP